MLTRRPSPAEAELLKAAKLEVPDATPPEAPRPPSYLFRFGAKRTEVDLESVFLAKGGSLGGAAARAETDFALTCSESAHSVLLTESLDPQIELEVPAALLDKITPEQRTALRAQLGDEAGERLLLTDRARLNITASRVGASINGTLVGSLSGQASVRLQELFQETLPLSSILDVEAENQANSGAEVNPQLAALSELLEQLPTKTAAQVRVDAPFEQVPVAYSNWGTHQAVLGTYRPQFWKRTYNADGTVATEQPVDVTFVKDPRVDAERKAVEPVLQGIYNAAWKMCTDIKFAPADNLTKSVMRVPAGYNGSGYALAAAVNDTPPSYPDATLESIFRACVRAECDGETADAAQREFEDIAKALKTPDPEATLKYAGLMASAMSGVSAFTMPYRVDGTPVVEPTGIKMVQSESWRAEAIRSIVHADDCDGSACSAVSILKRSEAIAADVSEGGLAQQFPYLAALGNSLGAHYVYGTTVLAANAGHADAANEHNSGVAGHAIALAIPKVSFLKALDDAAQGTVQGAHVVKPEKLEEARAARFDALYPRALRERIVPTQDPSTTSDERAAFDSYTKLLYSKYGHVVQGFQALSMEGTTLASSCTYTHDESARAVRTEAFSRDKLVATRLAPNITRTHKTLDSGLKGSHAFYLSYVEISFPMEHPLFTSPALRAHSLASPHYRFVKPCGGGAIAESGTSPKEMALHEYGVVPLWEVGEDVGATLSAAHAEAADNTMPMRRGPLELTAHNEKNLYTSLKALADLGEHLKYDHTKPDRESNNGFHCTRHMFSFASLINNASAIQSFVETVKSIPDCSGEISGLCPEDVLTGVAVSSTEEQVGRMAVLSLYTPLSAVTSEFSNKS